MFSYIRKYCLVINSHDEINIHFVVDGVLDINNSILIPNFSLEYFLKDIKSGSSVIISQILDVQLGHIFDQIDQSEIKPERIIYLENTTDYMTYFSKNDRVLLVDKFWKLYENRYLEESELSFMDDFNMDEVEAH